MKQLILRLDNLNDNEVIQIMVAFVIAGLGIGLLVSAILQPGLPFEL